MVVKDFLRHVKDKDWQAIYPCFVVFVVALACPFRLLFLPALCGDPSRIYVLWRAPLPAASLGQVDPNSLQVLGISHNHSRILTLHVVSVNAITVDAGKNGGAFSPRAFAPVHSRTHVFLSFYQVQTAATKRVRPQG